LEASEEVELLFHRRNKSDHIDCPHFILDRASVGRGSRGERRFSSVWLQTLQLIDRHPPEESESKTPAGCRRDEGGAQRR
jgi:hypothetical protein